MPEKTIKRRLEDIRDSALASDTPERAFVDTIASARDRIVCPLKRFGAKN
jgi:hypothetical protein